MCPEERECSHLRLNPCPGSNLPAGSSVATGFYYLLYQQAPMWTGRCGGQHVLLAMWLAVHLEAGAIGRMYDVKVPRSSYC
jgi:hypothetical protein